MTERNKAIFFEGHDSFEEGATFAVLPSGGLSISVAQEKAVDSYNASFTCDCSLTRKEVAKLRKWLNEQYGHHDPQRA